nr:YABBY2 protein [Averrhoa carambola]
MSTLNHLFDLPDQICYVQCGFCTTILLVSVPCSSLSMVVTVRCGHCTSLLSVNMMKASFVPLHLVASLSSNDNTEPKEAVDREEAENQKAMDSKGSPSMVISTSDNEEDDIIPAVKHIVNKPPEKRQRAPSAYNRFIKEEIKRLKKENPHIAHKEAFSTAAKNWAQNPPMQFNRDEESCGQEVEEGEGEATWNPNAVEGVDIQGNGFRERKSPEGLDTGSKNNFSTVA